MKSRDRTAARLLGAGLLLLIPVLALAGANEGGVLILHANSSLTYTTGASYCGQSGLSACSLAVTSVGWHSGRKIVFHALAAFPPESSPRMKGVSFGIDYDPEKFILVAKGSCADFEVNDTGWPDPGTGLGESWNDTQTSQLKEVYWFAGYAYSATDPDTTSFRLIPRALDGGIFVDDASPRMADSVAAYGWLGLGAVGRLACPVSPDLSGSSPDSLVSIDVGPGGKLVPSRDLPASPRAEARPTGRLWADGREIQLTEDQVVTGANFDALWVLHRTATADTLRFVGHVYQITRNGSQPIARDYRETKDTIRAALAAGTWVVFSHSGRLAMTVPPALQECFAAAIARVQAGADPSTVIGTSSPRCIAQADRWFLDDIARVSQERNGGQ
jgi:hypothetical protein